nr:hypothetical protein [Candidatus Frankia nodulisporulans]
MARFWCEVLGYVFRLPRKGSPPGTTSTTPGFPRIRVHGLPALIPQVWARDCSFSAFPRERSSRIGCILT